MANRLKAEYVGWNDFTSEERIQRFGKRVDEWSCPTTLRITVDDKVVFEETDGGEPEDNSFMRDWNWIAGEIINAYRLGMEHGKDR